MTGLLRVEDAKVHFGGVKAVDGLSITLERGKLYGVVGPNGSGKTTLINAISGITPLTAGAISFAGQPLPGAVHEVSRMGIARTFQSIKLLPTLTVRENIAFGADWQRLGDGEPKARRFRPRADRRKTAEAVDEAIERLRLGPVAGHEPTSLPYGIQRRVEIARALAGRPRLLLLDEPIAGMNREERAEIAGLVRGLSETGLTQLVIEHDLRTLLQISDHLFVMNFGKLIAEGDPTETASKPDVREAYLGRQHVAA